MESFQYTELLPKGEDNTHYEWIGDDGVEVLRRGKSMSLHVSGSVLEDLAFRAFHDMAFFLRPSHLAQLRSILDDPEASPGEQQTAHQLIRNAIAASEGIWPMCQDTGTAQVMGARGMDVRTDGRDKERLSAGIFRAYSELNLRYSQVAPLAMYDEVNTGNNLPAQIDLQATDDCEYSFLFMAKGGGSANKASLYQETPAILQPDKLLPFVVEKILENGMDACPPYHAAVVIGGTSPEFALNTAKYASARDLDTLPESGSTEGHGYRDREFEESVIDAIRRSGIGAQAPGKYFCHDVRVVRLPRHAGSLPIAFTVSCSADRQVKAKIGPDGVFIEKLETSPERYLTSIESSVDDATPVDLDAPMSELRKKLGELKIGTRLRLSGTVVVARDKAHARLKDHLRDEGTLPAYAKDHPIYYAGPAKRPDGQVSGSFGPTTARRMDPYIEGFQEDGGSLVVLAKGNRSRDVVESCRRNGGFYLSTIGGSGATIAKDHVESYEVLDFRDLGMEAVWELVVRDLPAVLVIDDKGNDLYALASIQMDPSAGTASR